MPAGIMPPEVAKHRAEEKALRQEYDDYIASIEAHPEWGLTVPKDFDDYLRIKAEAEAPPTEPAETEYSDADWHEFDLYLRYYGPYGDPADQRASSIGDYYTHQDLYLEQLTGFKEEEAKEIEERLAYEASTLPPEESARRREESYQYTIEARLRAEEEREYDISPQERAQRDAASYEYTVEARRRADETYARTLEQREYELSPEVQEERREESYEYTTEARRRADEGYARTLEQRAYELSPQTEAERREESYEYTEGARERALYAAQEAYHPSPDLRGATERWAGGLGSEPLGYQQWARQMFPTWESQYKSTLSPMVGYPTRELARGEEERRTAGLESYLQAGQEGYKQQYYQQSPYERGERPGQFNPALRQLSFR